MTSLMIPDPLAERLRAIARQENRPVEDVLASLLDMYARQLNALVSMDGMFEDDVSDLSASVRETMSRFYQDKYGHSN